MNERIRAKVEAGLRDLEAGDAIPHADVMREAADEGDWERLVVSGHPAFRKVIAESRECCHAGQGISSEELRRRLKRRRAAVAAGPSGHHHAPRWP